MLSVDELKKLAGELEAEKKQIEKSLERQKEQKAEEVECVSEATKIRDLIVGVTKSMSHDIKERLSSIVSTALSSVWDNPPSFCMELVNRRNQLEIDIFYEESGRKYNPVTGSGGGVKDMTSFALKVGMWTLSSENLRPAFIMDEPFKDVSPDLQHRVGDLLKKLSDELGLQFIMVSHAEDINISADKTFVVTKKGNYSAVV